MPDHRGPSVFTIPVHRNFADALVNGLLALYGRDQMTMARGMVLVPNNLASARLSVVYPGHLSASPSASLADQDSSTRCVSAL